jgi:hypothetical protein
MVKCFNVNAMKGFEVLAQRILHRNGIENPQPGGWYNSNHGLMRLKAHETWTNHIVKHRKAIPENRFPPAIDNLEKALSLIDMAPHEPPWW